DVPAADVEAATTKASAMEAAAMKATIAVKATAAAMATTASGICRDRQDHRASQHGSACGEFRPESQHQCRHGTPSPATKVPSSAPNRSPLFQSNKRKIVPIATSNDRLGSKSTKLKGSTTSPLSGG